MQENKSGCFFSEHSVLYRVVVMFRFRFYCKVPCIVWTMLSQDVCLSIRLSVNLSDTCRYSTETTKRTNKLFHCWLATPFYTVSQKNWTIFWSEHNFRKYCPIFNNSFTIADRNYLPTNSNWICHFTYSLLLHSLEKCNHIRFFTETVD